MKISIQQADQILSNLVFAPPHAIKKLNLRDRAFCLDLFKCIESPSMEFPNDLDLAKREAEIRETLFSKVDPKSTTGLNHLISSFVKGILNLFGKRVSSRALENWKNWWYLSKMGFFYERIEYPVVEPHLRKSLKVTFISELRGDLKDLWDQFALNNNYIQVIDQRRAKAGDLKMAIVDTLTKSPDCHIFVLTNEEDLFKKLKIDATKSTAIIKQMSVYRTFVYLRRET